MMSSSQTTSRFPPSSGAAAPTTPSSATSVMPLSYAPADMKSSHSGKGPAANQIADGSPKVVVQPVNPPISISLAGVDCAHPALFGIGTQPNPVHIIEAIGKVHAVPAAISVAATPVAKPSPNIPRPAAISKMVTTIHAQVSTTTHSVPSSSIHYQATGVGGTQNVPTTHLLSATYPVSHVRLPAASVSAVAPAVDSLKVRSPVAGGAQLAGGAHVVSGGGAPTGLQYVNQLTMHPGILSAPTGSVQHTFPSHLPRGAAAAAAMSAPKSGPTTAILRTNSPGNQTHFKPSTATLVSPVAPGACLAGQQLQVHVPAQLHMSTRGHSPAGLTAVVGVSPTGPPGITRAASPVSVGSHHPTSTEAHRAMPHSSLPQPHTGHPFRPDTKQISKADKKDPAVKPTGGGDSVKRAEARILEARPADTIKLDQVKVVDSQRSINWLKAVPSFGGGVTKHAYISSGLGIQRVATAGVVGAPATGHHPQGLGMTAPVVVQAAVSHGGTPAHNVSSSLVTATTLSHHTVPSQTVAHSNIRTSAVTSSSTQSQSITTASIPVAKVYPRQQLPAQQTLRPLATTAAESSYLANPAHRNSPGAAKVATSLSPAAAAVGEPRVERHPHPGVMSHGGSYPPYYFDPMNYRHMVRTTYGVTHSLPPTMVAAGVRSTQADSHSRHPVHHAGAGVGAPPRQNSLVDRTAANAAVAAASAAQFTTAAVGGLPVRMNRPVMIDARRQIAVHSMGVSPSSDASSSHTAMSVSVSQSSLVSPSPGSSPRPSILKRRINNDSNSVRKQLNLTSSSSLASRPGSPSLKTELLRSTSSSPKHSESLTSSQHSMDSNLSEASLETASGSLKIKQENDPITHSESLPLAGLGRELSLANSVCDGSPSPRKKPRKQQHVVATEHHDILDDQSTDEETETKHKHFRVKKEKKDKKPLVSDLDHVNIVHYFRRPCLRLIDTYRQSWKPTHNHFERYSDVRPKEEKKTNIHEIANQRGIVKKTDGWKLRHITYQFEDLNDLEKDVFNEMKEIKDGMSPWQTPGKESDTAKIYELIQGNIQRSQYVMEHLDEAKATMLKLLEHKPKVMAIIKSHANKRHAKKKHSP